MSKITALILSLLAWLFPTKTNQIQIKDQIFQVEIATSISQKATGLMNRSSLCPNCGMLFVFDNEGTYPFWMKNTLIPLDIIWLDQNGVVVDIKTGQPNDLTLLNNSASARYVLETNPDATGLKIGDIVNIPKQ